MEKIENCQTLLQLYEFEKNHVLRAEEQRLVFEKRLEIFHRLEENV